MEGTDLSDPECCRNISVTLTQGSRQLKIKLNLNDEDINLKIEDQFGIWKMIEFTQNNLHIRVIEYESSSN